MSLRGALAVVVTLVAVAACDYVVLPPEPSTPVSTGSKGWTAVATRVEEADGGGLLVELSIANETGDWSAMAAVAGQPATLTASDGATTSCPTVVVGSGGHRLAPGFRMRGFIGGTKAEPRVELIRVECPEVEIAPGATLSLDYSYVTGDYNYYDPEASQADGTLEVDLDPIAAPLTYPVATPIDGLVQPTDVEITGINDVVLTLTGVDRGAAILSSSWSASNPGEYPTYVHIGEPPVIGSDGILYGYYESPDLATVPVTPAGESVEWTTDVVVPADVTDLVMLLSVESKKQRLFVHYAIDLSSS